jgi:DNA-binding transcriptional LysR family regulator
MGVDLFTRSGRGMHLTPTGDLLLERARHILAAVDQARRELTMRRAVLTGKLTVGLVPSMSDRVLVPFLVDFVQHHPQLEMSILSAFGGELLERVARRELDAAIVWDEHSLPERDVVPLVQDPFFVIASPDAGLTLDDPIGIAALAGQPLILPSPSHSLRQRIEAAAVTHGVKLSVRLEVGSPQMRLEMVRLGAGWTILPCSIFTDDLAAGRVCCAPLLEATMRQRLVLATSGSDSMSQAARLFTLELTEYVQSRIDDATWPGMAQGVIGLRATSAKSGRA